MENTRFFYDVPPSRGFLLPRQAANGSNEARFPALGQFSVVHRVGLLERFSKIASPLWRSRAIISAMRNTIEVPWRGWKYKFGGRDESRPSGSSLHARCEDATRFSNKFVVLPLLGIIYRILGKSWLLIRDCWEIRWRFGDKVNRWGCVERCVWILRVERERFA